MSEKEKEEKAKRKEKETKNHQSVLKQRFITRYQTFF